VKPVGSEGFMAMIQSLQSRGGDGSVRIDVDGSFEISAPPGKVQVLAHVSGFAPSRSREIEVAPGEETSGIEVRLHAGATVMGRVTHGTDVVSGVRVVLGSSDSSSAMLERMVPQFFASGRNSATTDGEGRYEIRHVEAGTYNLSASHPDFAPSTPRAVTLRDGQEWKAPDIVLTKGGALVVNVSEGGEPKVNLIVQVMGDAGMKQGATNREGSFRAEGLALGECFVNIMEMNPANPGAMKLRSRVVAIEGSDEQELNIVFGEGYKIVGKVTGMPKTQATRIAMLRKPGGVDPNTVSPSDMKAQLELGKHRAGIGMMDADGNFEIPDIEPGEYVLDIPRYPADPTDLAAYETMDRTPLHQGKVVVKDRDVELKIDVR
ncbi:MAG: carboxypeptidase-like regulatory domain-containing protein, partial [Planctomycetota bacterium]